MQTTLQGCRVFYEVSRPENPAAPTALFLHGWGCDSSIFSFIASSLVQSATVISLDFPGHGKSEEPPMPWGVEEYADMVLALLDELKVDRVSIVAHSFGGRVALLLGSQRPERVEKLVITGGAGIKKPVSERQSKRSRRYKQYTRILDALKTVPPMTGAVEKWQAKLRNRYGSPDYVKLDEIMRKTFVKVISLDLFPYLGSITAPTLLLWGSEDTETPLWMGEQIKQGIPDAGLVIFEGRGHFAFLEEWQRFVLIMKEFLLEGKG